MAEVSSTTIANLALGHIGSRSNIESLLEESPEADRAELYYDFARRTVLEAYDWSFARKRLTLATHSVAAPPTWSYRYQYPTDCISFRRLESVGSAPAGIGDAIPFNVEGDNEGDTISILTDLDDAVGVYTRDVEVTTLFTPHFVLTLSHFLAFLMAQPGTGKSKIRQDQLEAYNGLLATASGHNANENVEKKPRDAEWTRDRGPGLDPLRHPLDCP